MSLTFRSATDTTGWLAVAVIAFVIIMVLLGRSVYRHLNREDRRHFTLIGGLASLPIILLAAASLPPLRPAYVFRYVLFASAAASLLIAIIICLVRFKKHHQAKQIGLFLLTFGMFAIGAYQAMAIGNRNLDTNSQNKLAQVVHDMQQSGSPAPVVVRSPYSYYAVRLYDTANYHTKFLFYKGLDIGSTKPLYDHPEDSVKDFNGLDKVWLVGEDRGSVVSPPGNWKMINKYVEFDDITRKPAAFAALYEKTNEPN